jgi:hypothetical protein
MHRRTALIVSLAALAGAALLAGCSGDIKPPAVPPDAGSVVLGRSCNVDAECAGLRCDSVRRQCVCSSDDQCAQLDTGAGLIYCDNFTGLCVASISGCKSDLECPSTSYCNDQIRACKARKTFCEPCTNDRECGGDSDNCVYDKSLKQSFCGLHCAKDSDCPTGASCATPGTPDAGAPVKQCWPVSGKNCKVFMGCTPDLKTSCNSTPDCGSADQICDPGSGLCVAREQVCPFGQACDPTKRTCVDQCGSDADCIAIDPTMRCVGKVCVVLGDCAATRPDPTGDKGCPANKVCSFNPGTTVGTCVPFCASDQECAPGLICLATTDGRRKCQAGCRMNSDCPLDRLCAPCPTTPGTNCCQGTTGVTCQSDMVCPTCSICDLSSLSCVQESEANDGYCHTCTQGDDSPCLTAKYGQGHCLPIGNGRCGVPCSQSSTTPLPFTGCPRGFACTQLCVGGSGGSSTNCTAPGKIVAECIPVDQSCTDATGQEKCAP